MVSGALLPLAFAPRGWWPAAVILCVPPALLWSECSAPRAVLRGWLFGMAMLGTGLYWIQISIRLYGNLPAPLAWTLLLLLSALLALCTALAALLYHRATRGDTPSPAMLLLAFPSAWTLGEWVRSWFLGGFPWLSLGYSQVPSPPGTYLPILGIYGAGWLTAATAGALACIWLRRGRLATVQAWLWPLAFAWLLGLYRIDWTERLPDELHVALVQGALPQQRSWDMQQLGPGIERYTRLSAPHWQDAELVIWPEAVLPAYHHQLKPLLKALQEQSSGELLVGALEQHNGKTYNSLVHAGGAQPPYRKRHLVPFGEFNPPGFRIVMEALGLALGDIAAGPRKAVLPQPHDIAIGASICYDVLFGASLAALSRDSRLLVNVSNDTWFGDSWGPHQHLQIAAARALENGRYLVRATNTGISAVVDSRGRVLSRSPQFRPAVLTATVPLYRGATPYSRWGDLPAVLLSALALAATVISTRKAGGA